MGGGMAFVVSVEFREGGLWHGACTEDGDEAQWIIAAHSAKMLLRLAAGLQLIRLRVEAQPVHVLK